METKSLLFGIIGFFMGGLLVSIAATTFDKPSTDMNNMTNQLVSKTGDEYDSLFISHMIEHHQAAVDMAKLSAKNAKSSEIKELSTEIIKAQEKEIKQMRQWQKDWNYTMDSATHKMSH